jgi:hypothetical protein
LGQARKGCGVELVNWIPNHLMYYD